MTSFQAPIQKQKVSSSVEQRLLNEILNGSLNPGDPLPSERELMRVWGVGRPAIREAMQSLQSRGLIEIRHGERAKVSQPSFERLTGIVNDGMQQLLSNLPDAAGQMREARQSLEVAMARAAAASRTDRDLEIMRGLLSEQRDHFHNPAAFGRAGHDFHAAVIGATNNPILVAAGRAMMTWLSTVETEESRMPAALEQAAQEHQAVYEAIKDRDPEAAGKAMEAHLTGAAPQARLAQAC